MVVADALAVLVAIVGIVALAKIPSIGVTGSYVMIGVGLLGAIALSIYLSRKKIVESVKAQTNNVAQEALVQLNLVTYIEGVPKASENINIDSNMTLCDFFKRLLEGHSSLIITKFVINNNDVDHTQSNVSFAQLGIKDGASIRVYAKKVVAPQPRTIYVKTPLGVRYVTSLQVNDTLEAYKVEVAKQIYLDPSKIILSFEGKDLDDKTLNTLENEATIHVRLKQ